MIAHRTTRSSVIALLALAAPAVGAQEPVPPTSTPASATPAGRPISLDEALRLARRNSPTVIQARGQIRSANAARRSAYAAFIPNVTLNATTTQNSPARATTTTPTGQIVPGNRWGQSQGFNANIELFSGFRRFHDIRSARAQLEAAETGEVNQSAQVSLQVKQQYYASLAALENEAAAGSQLAEAEQQLRAARAKVQARTATASDSLRARILVGNAQLAMLTARTDREAADAALGRFIGTPEQVTASAADSTRALASPIAEIDSVALERFVDNGPAILQARANIVAARAARRAARAPYLPTLTASYGRQVNGYSPDFGVFGDTSFYGGSLRFTLSYPLFNQYAREETIINTEVAEEAAEARLRDEQLAARQNLVRYIGQLRTAQQRAAIQNDAVAAAVEDLRIQRQRYELGVSTLLDVLTSQTQLVNARLALIQARLDARLAQAQIEALIGRDLGTAAP